MAAEKYHHERHDARAICTSGVLSASNAARVRKQMGGDRRPASFARRVSATDKFSRFAPVPGI
jgi:hypothetical protein